MAGSRTPHEVTLKPRAPAAALLRAVGVARQFLPVRSGRVVLFEDKITVRDSAGESDALPRRYTLTLDDRTAELYLAIGTDHDCGVAEHPHSPARYHHIYAELAGESEPRLRVSCVVDGSELTEKPAHPALRRRLFERELPFALAALRYGDRFFYERHPELDEAPVTVEFRSPDPRWGGRKGYGRLTDYCVTGIAGESRRLAFGAAALAVLLGIGALFLAKQRRGRGG